MLPVRDTELFVERFAGPFEDEGKPTLVMVHGLTSSIALNDKLRFPDWRELASGYPLVRYDSRGHGKSKQDHLPESYNWENLAEDLLSLCQALTLDDIVIGGSSMGAATCLHAVVKGLKVRGLVLAIPPSHGEDRSKIGRVYKKFSDILEAEGQRALTRHWSRLPQTEFLAREFPESRDISYRDFEENTDSLSMVAAFRGAALCRFPAVDKLKGISVPVLILCREDDPTHPVESARYLAQVIGGSKLHIATSADDVRQWPELVRSFLDELEMNLDRNQCVEQKESF